MILVDALYINNSGGLELLKYLIQSCEEINLNCKYLIDSRCADEFNFLESSKKIILNASLLKRNYFYIKNQNSFTTILCFGNVPPTIKTNAVVYTYFHNIFLAKTPKNHTFKNRILNKLKRYIIYTLKNNTNYWIVQTENTRNVFAKSLHVKDDKILVLPFYKIENINHHLSYDRSDYVYIANYKKEKNHEILIDAWNLLFKKGFSPNLHLTLSESAPTTLLVKLNKSIKNGVKIMNHGYIDKNQVFELYAKSKVCVYPSENESLGLGIVEAIENGCDLIAPDLDFIKTICIPSVSFKFINPESIAKAVLEYEQGNFHTTKLKIENSIDQLINLLK